MAKKKKKEKEKKRRKRRNDNAITSQLIRIIPNQRQQRDNYQQTGRKQQLNAINYDVHPSAVLDASLNRLKWKILLNLYSCERGVFKRGLFLNTLGDD